MTTAPGNPVLAPLRRWVLYSRTNLVLTALAVIVVLFLIGRVVDAPPPPRPPNAHGFGASLPATGEAMAVSYELVEVSESTVAGKTTQWTTSNAPATAMAYLHAFVDISLSDAEWLNRLAHYTADEPGLSFTAARPRVPVAITGSTRSELVTGQRASGSYMSRSRPKPGPCVSQPKFSTRAPGRNGQSIRLCPRWTSRQSHHSIRLPWPSHP